MNNDVNELLKIIAELEKKLKEVTEERDRYLAYLKMGGYGES